MIMSRGQDNPSGFLVCGRTDSWWLARGIVVLWHEDLAKEIDGSTGRYSKWRRWFGSSMRWWNGLASEVGWWFESTMVSSEIQVLDGAIGVRWLSIKGKAMEWIDAWEGVGFASVDWKFVGQILVVQQMWGFWWSGRNHRMCVRRWWDC